VYIEGDTDEGKFLNYIFGLPFLEPDEVEDSFVSDLISDMPSKNQIIQFCDYKKLYARHIPSFFVGIKIKG